LILEFRKRDPHYDDPSMTDSLIAVCKLCGHTVRISFEHGGRRAKCPKCEGIIEIPKGETSVRLRSDRELTREARAKAGRGPDSDPDFPAARSGGRGTARMRRATPKPAAPASKGRRLVMIITLVATVAIVAGIVIIIMEQPSGETSAAHAKKPPPTPPPPPVKEKEKEPPADPRIDMIKSRVGQFVGVFNRNDVTRLTEWYTADVAALTRAFGNILTDSELSYEDVKVKSVEFPDPNIKTTITFTRIRKYADGKVDKQENTERVLTWTQRESKWVISSPPEP
jgi:hypothetical protein